MEKERENLMPIRAIYWSLGFYVLFSRRYEKYVLSLQKMNRLELRFENIKSPIFQIAGNAILFLKRAILNVKLRFYQTFNYIF
jgi:hypothetical protein